MPGARRRPWLGSASPLCRKGEQDSEEGFWREGVMCCYLGVSHSKCLNGGPGKEGKGRRGVLELW